MSPSWWHGRHSRAHQRETPLRTLHLKFKCLKKKILNNINTLIWQELCQIDSGFFLNLFTVHLV
jgi:hypothetical protein